MWIPVTQEALDDSEWMRSSLRCDFYLMTLDAPEPTDEEKLAGRQTFRHDDHEHTVSIGWRAEQERRERAAEIEAEMAACPYVACTCGHHEDD